MAAAHKYLVLAAYHRKVAEKSVAGPADEAKAADEATEAARREAMRNHPSNYRAQSGQTTLRSAS